MKKQIFMAAVTLLISGSVALAQNQTPPPKFKDGQHPKEMQGKKRPNQLEEMRVRLKLTDAQVAQIKEIHQNSGVTPPKKGEQMTEAEKEAFRAAKKAEMMKVRAILTKEQQAEFDRMIAERKEAREEKTQGAQQ